MSARAEELAGRFERANDAMIAFVEGCSDAEWGRSCEDDGRTVGIVAHHVASAHPAVMGWVAAVAEGGSTTVTREQIDQFNEQHAVRFASCTRAEVLGLLREKGAAAAALVRGLSDEQLHRVGMVAAAGNTEMSAEQVVKHVLIGHMTGHLDALRKSAAQ